jgi:gas vesicle protein
MRAAQEHGFPYLIIGVGLGLLAGFLWAPRAGKEMRGELRRGADEGLVFLTHEAEKARAGADRWFARIAKYFGGDNAQRRGDLGEQARQQE